MRCGCGTHELTAKEENDLPRCQGIAFCFQSCIASFNARWHEEQRRLGFDFDVVAGPVEDIDVAELAGA